MLPPSIETKLYRQGKEVKVVLLDAEAEVFAAVTEFVVLSHEDRHFDIYVGEKELQHFSKYTPWHTKRCLSCGQSVGHDPADGAFSC